MTLFDWSPPTRYPDGPGFKDLDTSQAAAKSVEGRVSLLRNKCLAQVRSAGTSGMTADEAAEAIGETVLSVRPRFSELLELAHIKDSGQRRKNASGRGAKVWVVA